MEVPTEPLPPQEPIPIKVHVITFYYESGKSGNDYAFKEVCKVPMKEGEFTSLKKFSEYIR